MFHFVSFTCFARKCFLSQQNLYFCIKSTQRSNDSFVLNFILFCSWLIQTFLIVLIGTHHPPHLKRQIKTILYNQFFKQQKKVRQKMSENNFQDYSNLSSTFSYHGKHSGFQPYHEMTNFSNSSNFLKFLTSSQKIFSELDPDTSLVKEYKIEQGKIEQHQSGKQQESQRQKSLINQKVYEEEERKVQFIESSENEQSKRKKNQQIHRDIKTKKQDLGRGGNCVASNIVKTFIRIIESLLGKQPLEIFRKQVKTYSLKSQKENAIIILLLLHILVKQEKIKWTVYEKIIEEFSRNLKDSESNCEKKARKQSDRKVFHQKNRKMYVRFYEIIAEIYQKSRQNVKSQGQQKYSLEDLQQSVADTYERKQRQVQKAMSKIKSIILNHRPLQQFFDYYQNQIQSAFYEALDFAYRRNLSKRSKKVLDSTKRIFQKLDMKNTSNQKEKYMICYMATKLIHDKQEKIWSEFINNLLMKNKFNKSTQEVEALKICLEKEIPDSFRSFEQQKMKHLSNSVQKKQKDSPCKIQQEQSDYREKPHIFRVFNQLKDSLDF